MKFLVCLMLSSLSIYAMQLTYEESECFKWFDANLTCKKLALEKLSAHDRRFLQERYALHPKEVEQALVNFAGAFVETVQKDDAANFYLLYDGPLLARALLKLKQGISLPEIQKSTDIVSARIKAFSMLTQDERDSVKKDNYLKDPHAALLAMQKCGNFLAQEMVTLQIIEDRKEAKNRAAEEFVAKKMAEFKAFYGR